MAMETGAWSGRRATDRWVRLMLRLAVRLGSDVLFDAFVLLAFLFAARTLWSIIDALEAPSILRLGPLTIAALGLTWCARFLTESGRTLVREYRHNRRRGG